MNTCLGYYTVRAALLDVADERPDYIYEVPAGATVCLYVHDDKPGCIVGHVLYRLGVPLAELSKYEGGAVEDLPCVPDGCIRDLLARAQYLQDRGAPWGQAVRRAVESVEGDA